MVVLPERRFFLRLAWSGPPSKTRCCETKWLEEDGASGFWSAIVRGDPDEDVFRGGLGILDDHIEVAVFVEDAGIEQLEFGISFRTASIFFHQLPIRKRALRIFVKILHVGVRRRAVQVEVIFLHILAVIAFVAGQAEEAFLEDRIGPFQRARPKQTN